MIVVGPTALERDAGVGDRAAVDPHRRRRGRDREVAGAPFDLLVRAAGSATDRDPHLGEHLVGADRCRERPDVEPVHADDALAFRTPDHDVGLQRRHTPRTGPRRRRPGRAILRSCRGCARPDRRSPPRRHGTPGTAAQATRSRVVRRAASAPRSGSRRSARRCTTSSFEVVDVDQVLGVREPQLHHRQQASARRRSSVPRDRSLWSDAIAPSTLVARSYSNGAGVCTRSPLINLGRRRLTAAPCRS